LTAWRCGGILCSFCRQLKPIKGIKFNGFYCCLIYNFQLELPINSERLLIAPTSCRHNAKTHPMFTFSINSVIKGSNKIERTKGGARPKNRMGFEAPTT